MSIINKTINLILFLSLFFCMNSQVSVIKARSLESFCDINLYRVTINVDIVPPLKDYKSFNLNATYLNGLLFKCIIDPNKNKIFCITNLEQQKTYLDTKSPIILPYPFPSVSGVSWDYRSFVSIVFRRAIYLEEGCGMHVIKESLSKVNPDKWDLITKVNKIYGGQCLLSDTSENFYTFNINLSILGGKLKETLSSNTKASISLLQQITIPFTIKKLNTISQGFYTYYTHEYYKTAFCSPSTTITSSNYLNSKGIDFKCNIPISEQYIFNGPVKVTSFSDDIYTKVINDENESKIGYISIYFSTEKDPKINENQNYNDDENEKIEDKDKEDDEEEEENQDQNKNTKGKFIEEEEEPKTQSTTKNSNPADSSPNKPETSSAASPSPSPSPSKSINLRNLKEKIPEVKKKKEYLLLDDRKNNFICPDVPVFEIQNFKEGISFKPNLENDELYNIVLTGHLKNGYKISNEKIVPLDYVREEIKFKISVTNNLAEKVSEKKNYISCTIDQGSLFLQDEITEINCLGQKIEQTDKKNTDLVINWDSKENKYLNNIMIKWPKDLTNIRTRSKKLYSYDIYALSIKKSDYDCFDDKFYFYVDILDLNAEPQISFNISMLNPKEMPAQCKLYTSNSLKCFLNLNLYKISKGYNIRLPLPGNYNISTNEGNYINFTMFNFIDDNGTELADDGIITDQKCGNNKLVGAVQNLGYNYISALIIIICTFVIFGIVVFLICACVAFEITHRNRKNEYFSQVDEKSNKGTNPNNTTASPVNVTQNQGTGLPVKV